MGSTLNLTKDVFLSYTVKQSSHKNLNTLTLEKSLVSSTVIAFVIFLSIDVLGNDFSLTPPIFHSPGW